MNNAEDLTTPQGAREKRIYKIDTFVNQDGFKIEEHHLVDDTSAPPQFYGFYLVNTEIGPIDRYFKFKDQLSVDECFAQRLESLEAGAPQGPEVGPPPTIVDDNTSEEGCSPQNIPHVKEETPTT